MEATKTTEGIPAKRTPPHSLAKALPLGFTLLSLIAVAAANSVWLPMGVQAAGHGFVNLIGQDVRWNMFSADPRGVALDIWATIEHVDGTTATWTIERNVAGGDLRYYRFVQWAESAVLLKPESALEGLVGWLGSQSSKPIARITVFGSQQEPATPGGARPAPRVEVLIEIEGERLAELVGNHG